MAVVKVRQTKGTSSGSADENRVNAYTLEITAWVDNPADEPEAVLVSPLVPKVGSRRAADPAAMCTKVSAERDPDVDTLYRVTCDYESRPGQWTENPLNQPARYKWSRRREEFFFPRDRRGNYYRNTAGDPYENPPPTPLNLLVCTISSNVATYNPLILAEYGDAVNLDPFLGFSPGYAKIEDIQPSDLQMVEDKYAYYTLEIVVVFRPPGLPWHPHYEIAKGRRYKTSTGELVLPDADGVFHDGEVYLTETGERLDFGNTPYLQEFYPNPEKNFATLAFLAGLTPPGRAWG